MINFQKRRPTELTPTDTSKWSKFFMIYLTCIFSVLLCYGPSEHQETILWIKENQNLNVNFFFSLFEQNCKSIYVIKDTKKPKETYYLCTPITLFSSEPVKRKFQKPRSGPFWIFSIQILTIKKNSFVITHPLDKEGIDKYVC